MIVFVLVEYNWFCPIRDDICEYSHVCETWKGGIPPAHDNVTSFGDGLEQDK